MRHRLGAASSSWGWLRLLRRRAIRRSRVAGFGAGTRRFPPLQQHREPGRHRDRLQGKRKLDHRRLVEHRRRAAARPCCAAAWWRASTTSMRSTMTAAASGRAKPSCARARRNSPSAAPRTAWRAASIAPAFRGRYRRPAVLDRPAHRIGRPGPDAAAAVARSAGPTPPPASRQAEHAAGERPQLIGTIGAQLGSSAEAVTRVSLPKMHSLRCRNSRLRVAQPGT